MAARRELSVKIKKDEGGDGERGQSTKAAAFTSDQTSVSTSRQSIIYPISSKVRKEREKRARSKAPFLLCSRRTNVGVFSSGSVKNATSSFASPRRQESKCCYRSSLVHKKRSAPKTPRMAVKSYTQKKSTSSLFSRQQNHIARQIQKVSAFSRHGTASHRRKAPHPPFQSLA